MTLNYLYVSDSLSYIFNRDLFSVLWFYIFNCMLNPPVLQPSTLPYWVCIKALSPAIFSILRKLCPSGSSTKILWSYLWVISLSDILHQIWKIILVVFCNISTLPSFLTTSSVALCFLSIISNLGYYNSSPVGLSAFFLSFPLVFVECCSQSDPPKT